MFDAAARLLADLVAVRRSSSSERGTQQQELLYEDVMAYIPPYSPVTVRSIYVASATLFLAIGGFLLILEMRRTLRKLSQAPGAGHGSAASSTQQPDHATAHHTKALVPGASSSTSLPSTHYPAAIIFLRHAESEANVDSSKYEEVGDPFVAITAKGQRQAVDAGRKLARMIEGNAFRRAPSLDSLPDAFVGHGHGREKRHQGELRCRVGGRGETESETQTQPAHYNSDTTTETGATSPSKQPPPPRKVFVYCSPYLRTRQTAEIVVKELHATTTTTPQSIEVVRLVEDPRLRERELPLGWGFSPAALLMKASSSSSTSPFADGEHQEAVENIGKTGHPGGEFPPEETALPRRTSPSDDVGRDHGEKNADDAAEHESSSSNNTTGGGAATSLSSTTAPDELKNKKQSVITTRPPSAYSMGNFFSRQNGESSADVFDRVSLFFHTLWRDFRSHPEMENQIVLIVTHGLAMRVALMKWLNWNVTKFSRMRNPDNCDFLVLEQNRSRSDATNGPSGDPVGPSLVPSEDRNSATGAPVISAGNRQRAEDRDEEMNEGRNRVSSFEEPDARSVSGRKRRYVLADASYEILFGADRCAAEKESHL
eukprot:CAMPEP_0178982568 /NCGR_PEP_ID=MMETSP0795-20121207/572_1 /TAXON_ID=88552 /ORGANISM="Amoebophrya sp., Strain Ameob2" /LENGTH=598 /DNA_ID=CAMNT_0020673235 /DNA_START=68 /DNA_END=1865 /DNA_ORIENTATION=-